MTDSITIPKSRYETALRHLVEVQLYPLNYSQHKTMAWSALDALAPELSLLKPSEAWERLKGEDCMNIIQNPTCHFFSKLIEDMKDMSCWEIREVVDPCDVKGDRQECPMFGHKFVDQSGPGMSGDDYAGHEYIPIENMYLKIWYCC